MFLSRPPGVCEETVVNLSIINLKINQLLPVWVPGIECWPLKCAHGSVLDYSNQNTDKF